MDEALEILWTYARREPLDSNGETIVPTINNSIAAIRIIMRLEGWAMGSEKRKVNSEKRATPAYAMSDKPAHGCRGKVRESGVYEQLSQTKFAQSQNTQHNTDNDTNNHNEEKWLVNLSKEQDPHELLFYLAERGKITHFNQQIPSVSDIFIQTIQSVKSE